jgi:hypothetical protein
LQSHAIYRCKRLAKTSLVESMKSFARNGSSTFGDSFPSLRATQTCQAKRSFACRNASLKGRYAKQETRLRRWRKAHLKLVRPAIVNGQLLLGGLEPPYGRRIAMTLILRPSKSGRAPTYGHAGPSVAAICGAA